MPLLVPLRLHPSLPSPESPPSLPELGPAGGMSDALINGLAGAGGGIVAQLLTYPLLTINTRQQTEHRSSRDGGGGDYGTLVEMCKAVKGEGWKRLYWGLGPSLVGTAASQGVYYYFYQIFRSRAEVSALNRWKNGIGDGSVGMFQSLVVAAISGILNVLLTNPIWVIVTRMQTHKIARKASQDLVRSDASVGEIVAHSSPSPPYRTCDAVQDLYDEAGIKGFWKGVFPTLIMVSNPSIQFMLYETLSKKLQKSNISNLKGSNGLSAITIFLLGAVAKLGATVVTYPLLVVKSRLQVKQSSDDESKHRYKGTFDVISKMIRYEGPAGFYKGMSTKIVQSVFAAAVLFMVKEELVKTARLFLTKDLVTSSRLKGP